MNYSIGDFVIRLKNAALARRQDLVMPYTRVNMAIGKVLVKEGFLASIKENTVEGRKMLAATLRYERRRPVLTDVAVVSKPSLREYVGSKDILKAQGKSITAILSTNQGVMTGKEARRKGVGGELLFKIW